MSDAVVIAILSYYLVGQSMLALHRSLDPIDQPAYVHLPRGRRFLVGAAWPYVARLNGELGWFILTGLSTLIVVAAAYASLGMVLDSVVWRVGVIFVASYTPIVAIPAALFATVLWSILAKPLKLQIPSGMERRKR